MPETPGKVIRELSSLYTAEDLELVSGSGIRVVKQLGIEAVREVVYDVLCGKNLRDSTEILTRRRITKLNLATVEMFLKGATVTPDFPKEFPKIAAAVLKRKRLSKAERLIALWGLGLTVKTYQNVLRDEAGEIGGYLKKYENTCQEVIKTWERERGEFTGTLELSTGMQVKISNLFLSYLLSTIGAQTLSIRGSAKSTYGKLFEKLILGALLTTLGFKHVERGKQKTFKKVFWLSDPGEKRESDATLLYQAGKGVRFDIGFIGPGNPEISLDKVSRFEREISLGGTSWYMGTLIIVDRIGKGSSIVELAKAIDGTIIQMSIKYWPKDVARALNEILGYRHELLDMPQAKIGEYIKEKIKAVPLGDFIGLEDRQSTLL